MKSKLEDYLDEMNEFEEVLENEKDPKLLKEKTKVINHVLRASIYGQKFQITMRKKR